MRRRPALLAAAWLATLSGGVAAVALLLPDGIRHGIGLVVAGDLAGVRDYLRSVGAWAPVISFALVQLQAVVAPLPSFPIVYANGLVFGALWGGVLSWVSVLASAVLCFGLGRLLGRPAVERLVRPAALAWADAVFRRHGAFAVLLGRLIPLTAFDLLSYAAGLTPMRLGPFCLATGVGMTPAIFLSAGAGDLGGSSPWGLLAGLAGLGLLAGAAALLRPILGRRLGPAQPERS